MSNVTVVLVTYNSQAHLPETLAALRWQGDGVRLAVIDNASEDGSAAAVQQLWPDTLLRVNERNVGFAAAINQLLPHLHTRFVLLLNPDAVLLPGAVPQLVYTLEINPDAAAVGPRQWLDEPGGWQWSIVPYPPHWTTILAGLVLRVTHQTTLSSVSSFGFRVSSLRRAWELNREIWWGTRPQIVPYLSGACLLLRRDVLQAVGGLDDRYFLFFEDTELSLCLRRAGWSLLADPLAGVRHGWMGSVSALPDGGQGHLLTSGERFLRQHADPLTRWLWVTRQKRWMRRGSEQSAVSSEQFPIHNSQFTVHNSQFRPAPPYRFEVGLEPTFLYAAAIQTDDPAPLLPPALAHRPIYVRTGHEYVGDQTGFKNLSGLLPAIPRDIRHTASVLSKPPR